MESVRRPRDPNGRPKTFAFIVYQHECSIPYALEIFRGTKLFNRIININSRSTLRHIPVLDTHITEFTEPKERPGYEEDQEIESRRYQEREGDRRERNRNEDVYVQEVEPRIYHPNTEDNRRERNRNDNHRRVSNISNRHSQRESDVKEPTSWAELNALRGTNLAHSNLRSDLQGNREQQRESSNGSQMIFDFNTLLQMGQQMLLPSGCMGMGGFPFPNMIPAMGGLGPSFRGDNMYPSQPGMMGGSERYSPERDRGRRDNYDRRESRRDHPYRDEERHGHRDDHRRHDRGYTSSRSSHDRERRDRRSR